MAATAAYVFGYGSLVAMREPLPVGGRRLAPQPGRLHGYRRSWGVAMNNWEAAPARKHFVDPTTGSPPRLRVAFLDLDEGGEEAVNGLAVPVDAARLAAMDAREVNYSRVEVSSRFEPRLSLPVFAYRGKEAARERCAVPPAEPAVVVSADYWSGVRDAFASLGPDSLAEFERTTVPRPFPLRRLRLVQPDRGREDLTVAPDG